jgi:oligopeptide transport system ATP-binding protein
MARLLDISRLNVRFSTPEGEVAAVRDVDFHIGAGECVGLVGESGSGKSQMFLAALGLLARNGRVSGSARFGELDLISCGREALDSVRGARVGMIFQDSLTALAPHLRIGEQLGEVLEVHGGMSSQAARGRALAILERVHIGDAATRLEQYPHELSGGMRQRVMIAGALLCDPELVIADEPTTALDVTIQAQIIELFRELRRESRLSLVVITHDLAVVAGLCDRVAVMYAGRIVEEAPVEALLRAPRHPYTQGLLAAVPRIEDSTDAPMQAIPGQPPDPLAQVAGCSFAERCTRASDRCRRERPQLAADGSATWAVACHHPLTGTRA